MIIEILKILFLFLICWQGPIIIVRASRKSLGIEWPSFVLLAIGLTGFVYTQFLI